MQVSVSVIGPIKVTMDGTPVSFATNSTRSLLAYLAVELNRPQPRELLAALLWPNQTRAAAYTNLRQTIVRLRKAFPDRSDAATFLEISSQAIKLNRELVTTDLASFEDLLAQCAAHTHDNNSNSTTCPACLGRLKSAAALYQGEFLQGLFLEENEAFEEWLRFKRETLHQQALQVLQTLIKAHELTGEYVEMRHFAARQLAFDPLQEEAHADMMRALALTGDRTAALRQYEVCRKLLKTELGLEPNAETTVLFESIRRRTFLPVVAVKLNAELPLLPKPLTTFVGRKDEIISLVALLKQKDARLLTLSGAGGMGKTRLAIEVARAAVSVFGKNIFFISLASLAEPGLIGSAIATALGLSLTRGDPWQEVLRFLQGKKTLLVLDNFEHLLEGAGLVVQLLEAVEGVQCIVSSRERLQLQSEIVYQVEGLPYSRNLTLEEARVKPAVELFVSSARRVKTGFELNKGNLEAVLRICCLADGMPLALELAAAWLETLSIQTIASEIEESAAFLEVSWHDLPVRQRSIRAVFDWSWRLLRPFEQEGYLKLSVFRGNFTCEAAQTVGGVQLSLLMRLVQKSLVRADEDRFELHELARQFAWEKLAEAAGEAIQVQAKHSEYFLNFIGTREEGLRSGRSRQTVQEIEREIDNIRLAWHWATEHLALPHLEKSVFALWRFYFLTGLQPEGERAMGSCALRCRKVPDGEIETTESEWRRLRLASICLAWQAFFLAQQNYYEQTAEVSQEAIKFGQLSGENFSIASGCLTWGHSLFRFGSYQTALPLFAKAVELSRPPYDKAELAGPFGDVHWGALRWMANVYIREEAYDEARKVIAESLQFCRDRHIRYGELFTLLELCTLAEATGDYGQLEEVAGATLELAHQTGNRGPAAVAALFLGKVRHFQKAYNQARNLLEPVLRGFREAGSRLYEAEVLTVLGGVESSLGNYFEAEVLLKQALVLGRSIGNREAEIDALLGLVKVAQMVGRPNEAQNYAKEGLRLSKEIEDKRRYSQFGSPNLVPIIEVQAEVK